MKLGHLRIFQRTLVAKYNALLAYVSDGVTQIGTLAIDATPEKFKTTTVLFFRIAGIQYTKAATTALVFSAAHKITALKHGVVLIMIDAAGAVTTKVAAATQAYATAALALAAKPAPDAGKVSIGWIPIEAGAADWDALTDDLTNASDVTTAAFVDAEVAAIPTSV